MRLWMVYAARALALLWAGWWIFFAAASSIVEPPPAGMLPRIAATGVLFLLLAVIPWRWEAVGGVLLALTGLFFAVAYPMAYSHLPLPIRLMTAITLAGPPLAAGIVFLLHRWAAAGW
jgi:hypothetical protein